jgi:hypothetical protein
VSEYGGTNLLVIGVFDMMARLVECVFEGGEGEIAHVGSLLSNNSLVCPTPPMRPGRAFLRVRLDDELVSESSLALTYTGTCFR